MRDKEADSLAIVKRMAEENLDWKPACDSLALLVETNSKAFKQMVDGRANELYNSRLMTQVNKARATMEARSKGQWNEGYKKGFADAKAKHEMAFRCSVCGKPISIPPMSKAHEAVVQYLSDHNWGHVECQNQNKTQ